MCVVIADLAGFTAYADERGDAAAADLAEAFSLRAMQVGRRHDLRPIKTIGDAVLFVGPDGSQAVEGALALVSEFDRPASPLPVHVGVADGPVVERDGDVFGSPVNLAAHLAAQAAPGEVLVTAEVAAAARRNGFQVVPLGSPAMGLLRPLEVFRVAPRARLEEVAR
jgi:adenylate cyclase